MMLVVVFPKVQFAGADSVRIDGTGQLILYTRFGNIVHPKAQAWQLDGSGNFSSLGWQPSYSLVAANEVKFTSLGSYNTSLPLIIAMDWGNSQPQNILNLEWSTYCGGTGDDLFNDAKTDAAANLYVTGNTSNNNFPVTSLSYQSTNAGSRDIVTGKFDPDGVQLWTTYFGGTASDYGSGVAVDPNGIVFTTGYSISADFPPNVFSPSGYFQTFAGPAGFPDPVIFRLTADGQTCNWSTYYGGTNSDQAFSIECNQYGDVFITGTSESSSFPLQNPGGGAYYQTFAGPSSSDKDAFIVKFNATTLDNEWATYYGGTSAVVEEGRSITIDPAGNVVVVGTTQSSSFPTYAGGGYIDATLGGASDAFLLRFNILGVRQWATYYGGSAGEVANGVAVNPSGNIFATGYTSSTDFPVLSLGSAYNQATTGGGRDAFILYFTGASMTRVWATYYGGANTDEGKDVAIDQSQWVYVSGIAGSGFPFPTPPTGTYTQTYQGARETFIGAFAHVTMAPLWGSYLGGTGDEFAYAITTDVNGKLFSIGSTSSPNTSFPLDNALGIPFYQGTYGGLTSDSYITRFNLVPIVGVSDPTINESNALSVYPNPTNGQLFVNYIGLQGDVTFTIYNMLGEVVRTVNVGNTYGTGSYSFDLANIASGVYFVQAQCNGQITSKKFVKQ